MSAKLSSATNSSEPVLSTTAVRPSATLHHCSRTRLASSAVERPPTNPEGFCVSRVNRYLPVDVPIILLKLRVVVALQAAYLLQSSRAFRPVRLEAIVSRAHDHVGDDDGGDANKDRADDERIFEHQFPYFFGQGVVGSICLMSPRSGVLRGGYGCGDGCGCGLVGCFGWFVAMSTPQG